MFEQEFFTKLFTVVNEVEAIMTTGHTTKVDGIKLEPANNGKISMRSPSSNAISLVFGVESHYRGEE